MRKVRRGPTDMHRRVFLQNILLTSLMGRCAATAGARLTRIRGGEVQAPPGRSPSEASAGIYRVRRTSIVAKPACARCRDRPWRTAATSSRGNGTGAQWLALMTRLSDQRLIVPDRPGCGLTDGFLYDGVDMRTHGAGGHARCRRSGPTTTPLSHCSIRMKTRVSSCPAMLILNWKDDYGMARFLRHPPLVHSAYMRNGDSWWIMKTSGRPISLTRAATVFGC